MPYFPVLEIFNAVIENETKEIDFVYQVSKLLLRENDEQDFKHFNREDQIRLIEIAAKEWGCKAEYEEISNSLEAEERFFQAVVQRNNRFQDQMVKVMKEAISQFSKALLPNIDWFADYRNDWNNSIAKLVSPTNLRLGSVVSQIDPDALNQFSKIGKYAIEISQFDNFFNALIPKISIPYEDSLLKQITKTLIHYNAVMQNLSSFDQFKALSEFERNYPSIEMRNLSIATSITLAGDEIVDNDEVIVPDNDELTNWLAGLNSAFPKMLQGAIQTITSHNPDRDRHFASSHRELVTHILHHLAPNEEIKLWTNDPNHFCNGKPTRRARLLFIARKIDNGPFVEFFVSSFIAQIDLLNADEHRVEQNYSEDDLRNLYNCFLSTIGMLMHIVVG